jgi:hypothetical protein
MSDATVEYRREESRELPRSVRPADPADGPDRVGRFSDGVESHANEEQSRRMGRFSDGLEQHPDEPLNNRVGRFSDGQGLIRSLTLRVGRFSEGLEARSRR